ncbi:MAG: HAD-IC family P-type ATPase [Bacteroidetes bacterium]|nr:HAD-IC family P-type ATPase [Bacteroidota bacterium]
MTAIDEKEQLTCYHCGEQCSDDHIAIEEKLFCCEGCKMVFEILNENELCKYYDLDEKAGVSLKGKRQKQYAYLDDPEIQEKLLNFTDGTLSKVSFHLPQIHCASCIWLLENLYKLNEGVSASTVNFLKKEVHISYLEEETSLRDIVELLDSIGYSPAISFSNLDETPKKLVDRSFYYKLGIAAFSFGNIMLLSFPEYLGLDKSTDEWFFRFFGYLNILLALPIVFYSGRDYLLSAWMGLKQGTLNIDVPISLGILSLFGRSAFEILTHTGAGYMDSLAGLVFFLLIGKWFQQKTHHTLSFERDYKSYFPIAATRRNGNKEESIALNKIDIGDTIIIRHKELIPADGLLLKGNASIDYSFVTGEAVPIAKGIGEKVYAGGRQLNETIEITLTRKVSQSYLTQLWNDDAFSKKESETTASKLANHIGKYFTYIIISVAFITLIYWAQRDLSVAINAFTAVLIIACPCAVALSIPFTFGNAMRILARNHFYLKNTNVIESLQNIQHIVFDKTGTLTNTSQNEVHFEGERELTDNENQLVKTLVRQSSHPASRQIFQYLKTQNGDFEVADFEEIIGQGIQGQVKGQCVKVGSKSFIFSQEKDTEKGVFIKIGNTVKGSFHIRHTYRQGLEELMIDFQKKYKLALLSGDNDRERRFLRPFFPSDNSLHFNQSPRDKLNFIKNIQNKEETVLMLGDGLNDAGALQQSDVGIVVTENINNFTPACDAILSAEQLHRLPLFMQFANKSRRLVYYAYLFALTYNVIGLSFAVQGALSPIIAAILMPLSSISIVIFGMLSSNFLGYTMGLLVNHENET